MRRAYFIVLATVIGVLCMQDTAYSADYEVESVSENHFFADESASDNLDVSALYPYFYDENAVNKTDLMAHNYYFDPDLSSFSGKYSAYSIDIKVDRDPVGTYWSTVNFSMSGGAEGYAGIQNTRDGKKAILSIWEYEKIVNGRKITVTPERLFPDKDAYHFDNEGSGSRSLESYPWKAKHWYRVLVRCYEDKDYGHTVVEQWIQDRETMEWTLVSAFDTLQTNAYFTGNFSAFMENYDSDYCNKLRSIQLRNPFVQEYGRTTWKSVTKGKASIDTWYGNKKGGFSFGSNGQYLWGIVCGYGPDEALSSAVTSKTLSLGTHDESPKHSDRFYYEFVPPIISDFSVVDNHDGKPTLIFNYEDKSQPGDFLLKIDGNEYVTSANWRSYYDSSCSRFVYVPEYELMEGTHTVEAIVSDSYKNRMLSPYTSSFTITLDRRASLRSVGDRVISTKKKLYQGGDIVITPNWSGDGGSHDIVKYGISRRIKKKRYEDVSEDDGIRAEYDSGLNEIVISADETARPGRYRLTVVKQFSPEAITTAKYEFSVKHDVAGAEITVSSRMIGKRYGKSAKLKTKPFIYTMSWKYNKSFDDYVIKRSRISGCKVKYSIVGPTGAEVNDNIRRYVTVDKKGKIEVSSGFVPDEDSENNRFSVKITVTPKDAEREVVVNDLSESIFEIVER